MQSSFAGKKGLPSPENPHLKLTGGEINISKDDVEEVVTLLQGVKEGGGGDRAVVGAVLSAAAKFTDPPTLRAATVSWLERKKNPMTDEDRKFSDGIANAKPANNPKEVVLTHFYDAAYTPPFPVEELHQDISTWCTPTGEIWNNTAINDLQANCNLVLTHHSNNQPPQVVTPLWLYSASQLGRHKLWATWVTPSDNIEGARWKAVPGNLIEKCMQPDGALLLDPSWMKAYNFPAGSIPASVAMGLEADPYPSELRGEASVVDFRWSHTETKCNIAAHKHFYLVRYECLCLGNGQWSPLHDVVMWLPRPSENGLAINIGELPPSGVLEYLYSRGVEEEILWPLQQHGWTAKLCYGTVMAMFSAKCFAEPDQQMYNPALHDRFKDLCSVLLGQKKSEDVKHTFEWLLDSREGNDISSMMQEMDALSGIIPQSLLDVKLKGNADPPPGVLAHATEVQELAWGGKKFLVALSGEHPCVCVGGTAYELFRVNDTYEDQIFWHMNYAMRSKQFGTETSLSIKEGPAAGKYLPPPQEEVASEITKWNDDWDGQDDDDSVAAARAAPVTYTRVALPPCTAQWDGYTWSYSLEGSVPVTLQNFNVWLSLGTWLLPQAIPLIYYLDKALAVLSEIDGCRAPANLVVYRGLRGVTLPRTVYDDNKVVLWSAYSSASSDRGVASSFARGEAAAAVFALTGKTCVCISHWSRFGREREWLYPPNTTFQVTSTLSEEQAKILKLDKLQLFTMNEVSILDTLLVYLRSLVNVVAATVEGSVMPRHVEQIFGVMKYLTTGKLTEALEICLDPKLPVLKTQQGAEICGMLVRMGANRSTFASTALSLDDPDPVTFMYLVRAGASFEDAQQWMSHYETTAREHVMNIGMLIISETLERADIREECSLQFENTQHEYEAATNLALGHITTVSVTRLHGEYAHMNGVYTLDLPRVFMCPGFHECKELGWTLDATRPWGVFVVKATSRPASTWGLTSGSRVISMCKDGVETKLQGLSSVDGIIAELKGGSPSPVTLHIEEKPQYSMMNPTRFLSYCTITLELNGEWRIKDAELRQKESEKHPDWDTWIPVGRWKGKYDKTSTPYEWLLGQWAQRSQHQYQWYITGPVTSAIALCGGVTEYGWVHEGLLRYTVEEDVETIKPIKTLYDDTQLLEQARHSLIEMEEGDLDTRETQVAIPNLFKSTKVLPDGVHAMHRVSEGWVLVNHTTLLTYTLERVRVEGVYPYVTACDSVTTCKDGNTVMAPKEESLKRQGFFSYSFQPYDDTVPFVLKGMGNTKKWTPRDCGGGAFTYCRSKSFIGENRPKLLESGTARIVGRCKVRGMDENDASVEGWSVEDMPESIELRDGTVVKPCCNIARYEWDWWHVVDVEQYRKKVKEPRFRNQSTEWFNAQQKSGEAFEALLSNPDIAPMKKHVEQYEKRMLVRNIYTAQYMCDEAGNIPPDLPDIKSLWDQDNMHNLKTALEEYEEAVKLAVKKPVKVVDELKESKVDEGGTFRSIGGDTGLISLHIGQAGVQIGDALWDLYSREHEICNTDVADRVSSLLFRELSDGSFRPRALFIDTDPSTVDNLKTKWLFDSSNYIKGKQCSSDIYSRGFNCEGKEIFNATVAALNRQLEECDRVTGFHITHAGGGGTGGGFQNLLSELLQVEYGRVPVHNFTVLSNESSSPTGVYNTIFTLESLLSHQHRMVTIFDNGRLQSMTCYITPVTQKPQGCALLDWV